MNRPTPLILASSLWPPRAATRPTTPKTRRTRRPSSSTSPAVARRRRGRSFSGAVWVGNTLYLSGMLGLERGQVPETAEQEATNVLDNVKSTLETAGLTMDDLVVVQVYASDVGDYGAFNGVYRTYFTSEFPARAFLGSGTLLFGARFEVMGIAVRRAAAEAETG